ncbi:uncharacterized protein MELLADRAFT_124544 [Melampsora larici-populina 98AG31]|uniref:Secreted protein n=1 Tax=Melampsora larici-populina (strain 98AG31 / pathotype 3-4-7) TaxID=747676 RepID=F4RSP5_MELLP|nr:uncharacterized protein MELLADRAFT_124544 [Melampsora larici-populina 98AG31]EGG04637.1 secreted protein [Melampsora larici-populina 98AG31]
MMTKLFLSTIFCSILVSYVSSIFTAEKMKAMDDTADYVTQFMKHQWNDPEASFNSWMAPDVIVKFKGKEIEKKYFLDDAKAFRYEHIVKEPFERVVEESGLIRRWKKGNKVLSFKFNGDHISNNIKIVEIEIPGIYSNTP